MGGGVAVGRRRRKRLLQGGKAQAARAGAATCLRGAGREGHGTTVDPDGGEAQCGCHRAATGASLASRPSSTNGRRCSGSFQCIRAVDGAGMVGDGSSTLAKGSGARPRSPAGGMVSIASGGMLLQGASTMGLGNPTVEHCPLLPQTPKQRLQARAAPWRERAAQPSVARRWFTAQDSLGC